MSEINKLPAALVMCLSGFESAQEERKAAEEGREEDASKKWSTTNYRVPGYLAELAEGEKADGNKYDLVAISINLTKSFIADAEKKLQAGMSMVVHRINGHKTRGYSRKTFLSVAFSKDDKLVVKTAPLVETSRKVWSRMTVMHEKCCAPTITGNSKDFYLISGNSDIAKAKARFPFFMKKVMPFHESWSDDLWETIMAIQSKSFTSLVSRFRGKGSPYTWQQLELLTKDDMSITKLYGYNMSGYHVRYKPEKMRALVGFMYNQGLLDRSLVPQEWFENYERLAAAAAAKAAEEAETAEAMQAAA